MQKNASPQRSYDGIDVYVGIDVHKRRYVVVAQVEQDIVKKWSTVADPAQLAQQLRRYFPGARIHSAYEAGFSGCVLHRVLKREGIDNRVVHPAAIEVAANARVKTDKRDAKKLASQLAAGRLKAIAVPSEAQEHRRLLSRTRSQLVKERTAIKNRIRMKAHQFGLIGPQERREMSHAFVQEILQNSPAVEFQITVEALHQVWKTLDTQIGKLNAELKRQAQADPNEATYRSAPAVGPLGAWVLSNELGNLARFSNERELFSYTGLTPSEQSSGESIHRGRVTKQGNRHIRGILIEVAWRALKQDPDLAVCFTRIQARAGAKRAIVAVARKLIGKVRAAFRKGELYQVGYCSDPALVAEATTAA